MFSEGPFERNYSHEENEEKVEENVDIKKLEKSSNFQKNGYLIILTEKIIH